MKYVIDSSVAFKWSVKEVDSDKADAILTDFLMGIHELHAPDFYPVELAHSITRAERQHRITQAEGVRIFADQLVTMPVLHVSLPDLLPVAYAISSKMRIGVYDCVYVALADRENCEFITADNTLVKNLQSSFPFIVPLSSMP
jgi:predicted nucleic acid-binding protein